MADISKLAKLHPEAYSSYLTNRDFTLKVFSDMEGIVDEDLYAVYGLSPLVPPDVYYNEYKQHFDNIEANMAGALSLNRFEHLRDFFLVCNGFKNFGNYTETMASYKADDVIQLNGFVDTLKNASTDFFLANYEQMGTIVADVAPAACELQEIATAKIMQTEMTTELINAAAKEIIKKEDVFYKTFLEFDGFFTL